MRRSEDTFTKDVSCKIEFRLFSEAQIGIVRRDCCRIDEDLATSLIHLGTWERRLATVGRNFGDNSKIKCFVKPSDNGSCCTRTASTPIQS